MRKIAMVGTASSGAAAPYHDESWEIWGVSNRAEYVTRATRWFELHRLDGEPEDWAKLWRKVLKKFIGDTELWMMYPEPSLSDNLKIYPHEEIVARFGTFFMTSTFSWMMALAINELRPIDGDPIPGEISIYGVDMEYGTEYRQQRAGFRHFIELAKQLKINVTRLADGGLAYEPVPYPMWQDDPLLAKLTLRSGITKKRLKDFSESLNNTQTMIAQDHAVLNFIDEFKKNNMEKAWLESREESINKEIKNLTRSAILLDKDIIKLTGTDEEQQWLVDYLQP